MRILPWILVALAGAAGWGRLALARGETVSAAWLVIAAVMFLLVETAIAAKLSATRPTVRNPEVSP